MRAVMVRFACVVAAVVAKTATFAFTLPKSTVPLRARQQRPVSTFAALRRGDVGRANWSSSAPHLSPAARCGWDVSSPLVCRAASTGDADADADETMRDAVEAVMREVSASSIIIIISSHILIISRYVPRVHVVSSRRWRCIRIRRAITQRAGSYRAGTCALEAALIAPAPTPDDGGGGGRVTRIEPLSQGFCNDVFRVEYEPASASASASRSAAAAAPPPPSPAVCVVKILSPLAKLRIDAPLRNVIDVHAARAGLGPAVLWSSPDAIVSDWVAGEVLTDSRSRRRSA